MQHQNLKISITILTYNRCELLSKLLTSLTEIKRHSVEIIVVDNHSSDNTPQVVADCPVEIRYFRNEENLGVAARNIGLKNASGDIVITLDDDVIGIDDDQIDRLIEVFQSAEKIGAVNFRVVDPDSNEVINWSHHRKVETDFDKTFDTYEISEGAVAFRRELFEQSGYYPEEYFISHEGPDLAFRILEAGYTVVYVGTIIVQHYRSDVSREPWRKYYYDTRNQYWLAYRYFPFFYALKYLLIGQMSMMVYSIRDRFFLHWLRAVKDGIFGMRKNNHRRVLSKNTMKMIREIDRHKPGLIYMTKKRLFQTSVRI